MSAAPPRSFPQTRLPSTGGVQLHANAPPHSSPTSANAFEIKNNERLSLDRPLSASGRTVAGLAAYKVLRTIGRGKFGVCQLVESIETRKQYVLKCISLTDQTDREKLMALQEVETLKRLQQPKPHPFIVKYHENFLYQDALFIVMQFCEGGDLHHFLRERKQTGMFLEETVIIDWLIQLLLAIRKCHELHIIHRDIKSQNIFLVPSKFSAAQVARDAATAAAAAAAAAQAGFPLGTLPTANQQPTPPPVTYSIKLGDFGISKILNSTGELAMSVVGTPYSMSPEVCENKPYSFKSDIWAIGCVLYELCVLKHAFDSNNLLGLVWKIVQESYPPIPELYSHDLRDLVSAMLAKDPAARPTVEQILDLKFIKKRLKVQVNEKIKQRNLKRHRSRSGHSPTPLSQQEESTQNVFDNAMSVTYEPSQSGGISRYRPPDFYDREEDGGDNDSMQGQIGESSSQYHHRDEDDMGQEYSHSSSVAHFSKSTVMPSRPILGGLQTSPNLSSTQSPRQASTPASKARDRSRSRESRRPSNSSNNSSICATSGGIHKTSTSEAPAFLSSSGGASGSGLGSGSNKRLASLPPDSPNAAFGSDTAASSGVVLGRAGSTGTNAKKPPPTLNTATSPPQQHRAPAFASPTRSRGSSLQQPPTTSPTSASSTTTPAPPTVVRPNHINTRHDHSPSPRTRGSSDGISSPKSPGAFAAAGNGTKTKEQLKAQVRATQRIAQQTSFASNNASDDENDDRPATNRKSTPTAADEDELTEALRRGHLLDHDGADGLGESSPEPSEDEQDEDLMIEQLQSQLQETGDPEEGDSPIFFLPSSSDEEGDEEDEEDGNQHQQSHQAKPPVHLPPPKSSANPSSVSTQRSALQPLSPATKQKAANLLSTGASSSSSSSSKHPPVSPSSSAPIQPSLRDKFQAVKDRCMRQMSESAFEEIWAYFTSQALLSPRGSAGEILPPPPGRPGSDTESKSIAAVRERLQATGHVANIAPDLIFSVEQLVYLQQVLDRPIKK